MKFFRRSKPEPQRAPELPDLSLDEALDIACDLAVAFGGTDAGVAVRRRGVDPAERAGFGDSSNPIAFTVAELFVDELIRRDALGECDWKEGAEHVEWVFSRILAAHGLLPLDRDEKHEILTVVDPTMGCFPDVQPLLERLAAKRQKTLLLLNDGGDNYKFAVCAPADADRWLGVRIQKWLVVEAPSGHYESS